MRLFIVIAAVLALTFTPSAGSFTIEPLLGQVAAQIAKTPQQVKCYESLEPESPQLMEAWGYVRIADPHTIHLDGMLCAAAIRLGDESISQDIRASAALTLTHEAFHQARHLRGWSNERLTECRAIRHTKSTLLGLGASRELADRLYARARLMHLWFVRRYPEYRQPGCKVPR